jgi:choline kinase/8-oxo-dGTP pyrophosphatase MutT (NUDIX family)
MLQSLFRARVFLEGDTIISYADILYEPRVLQTLINTSGDICVALDSGWKSYYAARAGNPLSIAESLTADVTRILEIGQPLGTAEPHAQYIGLLRLNANGAAIFIQVYDDLVRRFSGRPWRNSARFEEAYLTDFLQELIERGIAVTPAFIERGWLEFDTATDYERVLMWDSDGSLGRFIALEAIPRLPSVVSAGGVVIRRDPKQASVLLVGDGTPNCWRLPKGMQNAGEAIEATAIREVLEETGVRAQAVRYIDRAHWTYTYAAVEWEEYAHFFLMKADTLVAGARDTEHDAVRWLPIEDAVQGLAFESERKILLAGIAESGG